TRSETAVWKFLLRHFFIFKSVVLNHTGICLLCFTAVKRHNLKVRINATGDTITFKFVRPSPNTKLEGYILGYGSSMFSKQFIQLPEDGVPYETEVDAEPKYLIAVQPIPANDVKKQCTGQVNLEKPLHLVIGSVTPTSVLLSWGMFLKMPYEGSIMNDCLEDGHYTVRYRPKHHNKKWTYQTCPTRDTVIDRLRPNTPYEFGVRPSKNKQDGVWSRPVVYSTNGKVFNSQIPFCSTFRLTQASSAPSPAPPCLTAHPAGGSQPPPAGMPWKNDTQRSEEILPVHALHTISIHPFLSLLCCVCLCLWFVFHSLIFLSVSSGCLSDQTFLPFPDVFNGVHSLSSVGDYSPLLKVLLLHMIQSHYSIANSFTKVPSSSADVPDTTTQFIPSKTLTTSATPVVIPSVNDEKHQGQAQPRADTPTTRPQISSTKTTERHQISLAVLSCQCQARQLKGSSLQGQERGNSDNLLWCFYVAQAAYVNVFFFLLQLKQFSNLISIYANYKIKLKSMYEWMRSNVQFIHKRIQQKLASINDRRNPFRNFTTPTANPSGPSIHQPYRKPSMRTFFNSSNGLTRPGHVPPRPINIAQATENRRHASSPQKAHCSHSGMVPGLISSQLAMFQCLGNSSNTHAVPQRFRNLQFSFTKKYSRKPNDKILKVVIPSVTPKPNKQERRQTTTTSPPTMNASRFDIGVNSSVFSSVPLSDVDAMGQRRFTAPHVVYKVDKKPDEPCSITNSLSHFPEEEVSDQNATAAPKNPPTNLTVVTVEGCPSFIILDWEKPDNDTSTEYQVTTKQINSSGVQDESVLTTNQTHSAVENLQPNSSYEFTVQAKNEFGTGPPSDPVTFSTESADPRVSENLSGKDAIWTEFPFKPDAYSECNGKQYVKRTWYRKFVGVQLCNSLRYKIYLSDSLKGKFYNIGDQTGHGEDHCQFVDSFLDGRTGHQLTGNQLPPREGYYRAVRQEPVNFGQIGGNSHITYVPWYECGTTIPGKW
ncbi:TARSH protein, partial [Atractosteus spatula]|nr:TARSH protein [Atractosteus spatula]